MHHKILVKIKANRLSDAKTRATTLLEGSVDDDENTAGWDYVSGEPLVVTQKLLAKEKCKTFPGLERSWKHEAVRSVAHHKAALKDVIFNLLVTRYAYGRKALAYLRYRDEYGDLDDKTKKLVLQASKAGRKARFPSTRLDDIAGAISELVDPAMDPMISYHLRQLHKLHDCIACPLDICYTLQSTDNHFADLGGTGRQTYYFIFDRHF